MQTGKVVQSLMVGCGEIFHRLISRSIEGLLVLDCLWSRTKKDMIVRLPMNLKAATICAALSASLLGILPSAEAAKILLGPHAGDATIVDIRGVNSDRASVTFRRELDDKVEDCTRELGDDPPDSRKIAKCVKDQTVQEHGRIYTRRAYCSRLTIYTEFGNFSMVNHEKENESTVEGKPYRPVRTDWKDHRSGEIVGNCSACNTPQMLSTLKVLCPIFYDDLFKRFDPY